MSMQVKGPINKLKACPGCKSELLVVVVYGGQRDETYLECEGCCSVVQQLSRDDTRSLLKTTEGQIILGRGCRL